MSPSISNLRFSRGDRLYEPLWHSILITACCFRGIETTYRGPRPWELGDVCVIDCLSLDTYIRLPIGGAIEIALANETPIGFEVTLVQEKLPPMETPVTGFNSVLSRLVSPIFSDFYDPYKDWIRHKFGTNPAGWPSTLNFARIIRNAVAHGGRIEIRTPTSPGGQWRAFSYSHADHGKRVIGSEFSPAAIILLLIDLGGELDHFNCPLLY